MPARAVCRDRQRIDNDITVVALDDAHDRQIKAADLVDAIGDFEQGCAYWRAVFDAQGYLKRSYSARRFGVWRHLKDDLKSVDDHNLFGGSDVVSRLDQRNLRIGRCLA